jgi:polyisoprenoid-binding protein YceI
MQTNALDRLDSKHARLRKAVGLMAGSLFAAQGFNSAFATTPTSPRWVAADEHVVQDTLTRLEWTRADNGYDIDWTHAKQFCNHLPGKWRLPTIDELAAIYESSKAAGARCGASRCGISGPFRLSAEWFWSADAVGNDGSDGAELAWGFLMVNGARTKSVQYAGDGSRALCVRVSAPAKQIQPAEQSPTASLAIDPSHTAIILSWTHHGFSHPLARLEQPSGTLLWNRADLSQSSVEVTMSLEGLRTGDDDLNKRLRGSDFFDAGDYPTITFKSTEIMPRIGTNEFTLVGALTVHGTTKAVTLMAKINSVRDEPGQPPQMGFDADGVLRRSDFGLSRYVPMVSDEIAIHITLEARSE